MASACALAMFSGKIIFIFGIPERLRTLRYSIFTGRELPQRAKPETLRFGRKLSRHAKGSPFGRAGALAPERARMRPFCQQNAFPRTAKGSPLRESRKSRQALTERGAQEKFSAVVTSVISVQ